MTPDFKFPDDLLGTRWFTGGDADSRELLVMDASGRAVQFHATARRLPKGEVMRLWYSVDGPCTLRFKGAPDAAGWVRTVSRGPEGFSISAEDKVFPLCRPEDGELPEWIREDLEDAIDRMIEREKRQSSR